MEVRPDVRILFMRSRSILLALAVGAVLIGPAVGPAVGPAMGQDLRATLFADTDVLLAQGQAVRADVLAPKSWTKAMEKYQAAEKKLDEGKNLDDIRKELAKADEYFAAAIKATDLARVTLATSLKARDDAVKAEAPQSATELWIQGETKFAEAGRKLEEGNVNDCRKRSAEAEALFRDAELAAIKTSFFDETRKLLAQAETEKVEKYAPVTLARSHSLLAEAEAALNENRYDSDRPRSLAMEARYEALHALHLAKMVRLIDDKAMSSEEMILKAEEPLARIGGALDVQTGFEEGFARPTDAIVAAIEAREAQSDGLTSDIHDRDARIAGLTDQVTQLETKLGGVSEVQQALQAQVEAQEMANRRFAQVEQKFTRDEARVMREEGNIVIRMVGMNFASAKAEIRPESFALLTKVKEAIAMFPEAQVTIEGHTDAYGTDEANLALSQQRAEAVAQYLLANSNLSAGRVKAEGFGETQPIANNETKEGREKNRRIDVVISQEK
jgi:OOP family OmpA-OmpF porin